MFIHNYLYSLRLMLGNKQLVFWTLAFPLIMAMLFNMAFSNIEKSEKLDPIDIAVVDDSSFRSNMIYTETLETLGKGDDRIFNITYTDAGKAEKMLRDGEITGFVRFEDNEPRITVRSNGIDETIMCSVFDEIGSESKLIMNVGMTEIMSLVKSGKTDIDYQSLFKEEAEKIMGDDTGLTDTSPKNMSFVMIEYYSLIAMACMYSGLLSMTLMNYRLANISPVGRRSTISPSKRLSQISGSLTASFTVQLFGLAMLYLLLIFVVRADFGTKLPEIILLSLLGSLAGLTLGVAVAVLVKINENAKLTVLLAVVMAGCFFAGMMGITMKNIIDKNAPFINRINPVAMITDGLYALYYYDSGERYLINVISLAVFSAVMMLISVSGLRRQRYDSL